MGGPSVGLGVRGIITAYDISDMHSNKSSPVSCRAEIYSLLLLVEMFLHFSSVIKIININNFIYLHLHFALLNR